jgi:predicted nucleotidyltransferase
MYSFSFFVVVKIIDFSTFNSYYFWGSLQHLHNPTYVGVFGSFARGEQNEKSDMDILIDYQTPLDLLEIIGLENELSEMLGIKVDLVTQRSLNKIMKPYIQKDLIQLL